MIYPHLSHVGLAPMLSRSRSRSRALSLSLSPSLSLRFSLSLYLSLYLSGPLSLARVLSVSFFSSCTRCLSRFLSRRFCSSLSHSLFLSLLSFALSSSISLFRIKPLSFTVVLSHCLSFFFSVCLARVLSLSIILIASPALLFSLFPLSHPLAYACAYAHTHLLFDFVILRDFYCGYAREILTLWRTQQQRSKTTLVFKWVVSKTYKRVISNIRPTQKHTNESWHTHECKTLKCVTAHTRIHTKDTSDSYHTHGCVLSCGGQGWQK